MDARKRIFISCVTSELGQLREELRRYLARADCDVKVQEDFYQSDVDLIEKLNEYIRSCAAVIHLVGGKAGTVAEPRPVREYLRSVTNFLEEEPELRAALGDFSGLSYTQWEAYLAVHHRVPLFVYAALAADAEAGQQLHVNRLKLVGRYPEVFASREDLLGKLIGDLRNIVALPEPGTLPRSIRGVKAFVFDYLAQFPDFLVKPTRFFQARFERGSNLGDALLFAAIMAGIGFAVSVALRTGDKRLEVAATAWATLGNVTLWLMYAIFMHPFAFIAGARRGMTRTLAAYLYTISALQPVFIVALFAIQAVVPGAVQWQELKTLGGSGAGQLIAEGNMLTDKAVTYYRAIGGIVILTYFAIGIAVGHRLAWWRCGLAVTGSLLFFVVGNFFVYLLASLTGLESLVRLIGGR